LLCGDAFDLRVLGDGGVVICRVRGGDIIHGTLCSGCASDDQFRVLFDLGGPVFDVGSGVLQQRDLDFTLSGEEGRAEFGNQFLFRILFTAELVKLRDPLTVQALLRASAVNALVKRGVIVVRGSGKVLTLRQLDEILLAAIERPVPAELDLDTVIRLILVDDRLSSRHAVEGLGVVRLDNADLALEGVNLLGLDAFALFNVENVVVAQEKNLLFLLHIVRVLDLLFEDGPEDDRSGFLALANLRLERTRLIEGQPERGFVSVEQPDVYAAISFAGDEVARASSRALARPRFTPRNDASREFCQNDVCDLFVYDLSAVHNLKRRGDVPDDDIMANF